MKRILFIAQHLNRAGTEAFMMNVFRSVDKGKFSVDFLLYNRLETDYTREVEAAGCKIWRVTSRRESPWKWYAELNRFFKEHANDYAAIHYCGNGLTAIAPIILAWHYGVKIRVCHSHNSSSEGLHNRVLHKMQRGLAARLTTHHFACSTAAAKWFYGDSPAVIIRNGIDTKRFAYDPDVRKQVRMDNGIGERTRVVGHVGRLEAEKNHTFMLDVFAEMLRSEPDSLLVMVGKGSLMDKMQAKAKELGIWDKTRFMGERKDVDRLLQAMDLFMMPSVFEGQPFVLIEAQCAGLPCLVSDAINDDICLTDSVVRMSLNESVKNWSEKALQMMSCTERQDKSGIIEEKGYSISSTIDYLEGVYNGINK